MNGLNVAQAAVIAMTCTFLAGCAGEMTDRDVREVGLGEVKRLHDRAERDASAVLLIDPRPASAFAEARLPRARNLTLADVASDLGPRSEFRRFDEIVVYGDGPGTASARAMTKRLMALGYDDVRLFSGGLREWRLAGFPIEP